MMQHQNLEKCATDAAAKCFCLQDIPVAEIDEIPISVVKFRRILPPYQALKKCASDERFVYLKLLTGSSCSAHLNFFECSEQALKSIVTVDDVAMTFLQDKSEYQV